MLFVLAAVNAPFSRLLGAALTAAVTMPPRARYACTGRNLPANREQNENSVIPHVEREKLKNASSAVNDAKFHRV